MTGGPSQRRTPASTYRLQVTADFDLFEAARRLPYLHDLGVDWVYLSPLLEAEPGSTHGYDVVRFDRVDESRGGAAGLEALSAEARRLGMGVLVDIVPNHAGVATPAHNPWWWDVLEHGRDSEHADAFDIDWDFGGGRLRIPVLADDDLPVGDGPIGNLELVDGELSYHGQRFPVSPGTEEGGDATAVHGRQHYELVSWRRADSELNYRRFFSVNTLAGVRVEDPAVFDATHREIGRWFVDGLVDGLRVDHPDGLRDPHEYLDDLSALTDGAYVLVEKILALRQAQEPEGEELPSSWPTAGTTGYDVLATIDRVLVDPAGEAPLVGLDTRLRGKDLDWEREVHDRKLEVATGILRSETRRIVRELPDSVTTEVHRLEEAVAELLACFEVYRTYLPEGRPWLDRALERARDRRPDLAAVLDELAPVLSDPGAPAALRFQQTSGMVMAKGVEDCAFYRYAALTSLNEVGGDPSVFAVSADEFHTAMATRQEHWPHAMTTLTTHDTKRGEDVRARITVLSELPEAWAEAVDRLLERAPLPDPAFGSLLWQAVLGAWPTSPFGDLPTDLRDRLHAYAEKAMREAGRHTTWTDPDPAYEAAVHGAVDAAFDDVEVRATLAGLLDRVVRPGWSNALAAKLVALTAPGVCDVYQGSELWELSLVDPDNRRPVDFDRRRSLLEVLDETGGPGPLNGPDDTGAAKLWVVRNGLRLRRDRPDLFTGYTPVSASGPSAGHLLGFDRGGAITLATRLPVGLEQAGGWRDTSVTLPAGRWRDVLAGPGTDDLEGEVQVATVLASLPVALLVREEDAA
ncbi:malto-oligosyltrehalose synthase [Nocardioides pocheonensis]|uniref:Malto-oligosyltrehalose synthase n=1 Tax=Nocardioides pocheonensis TaxID=661485 RepID=A0A3N0GJ06_9ACTN|nr:malto-oligosyltrehalose synthase [Nocardioides pocheonensis]RNM12454.1 malto-oligosyltrehalose synthase [Nocardioides pocheonensis]